MKSLRRLAITILLSSTALAQNGGLKFSLRDLNNDLKNLGLPAIQSTANGINNNGQIAGNVLIKVDQECFYFPAAGATPQVFYKSGATQIICDARAIDAKANIAGSVWTNLNRYRAFRRNSKGTLTMLQPDDPFHHSYGNGIVNGIVVGYMSGSPFSQAATWDATGALTNPYPDPNFDYVATGINSSGQIVGYVSALDGYNNRTYAGFSLTNGSITVFCCDFSMANVVNANGHVAGESDETLDYCGVHTVVWYGSAMTDLGYCFGVPLSISTDNWIAGYTPFTGGTTYCSAYGMSGDDCSAFLATLTPGCRGPFDLNVLLDSSGAGWILKEATGINDSHQIVGYGIAPNGDHHAFLLTPNNLPLCSP